MATKKSSTPSFFNVLKEAVLLLIRNWKLFVLVAASTSLLLCNDLAEEYMFNTKALNGTNPNSPDMVHLIQEIQEALMLASEAYLLFGAIVGSIIRIIILFAAVATYSGELHTFVALLGKAKTQLKGPLVTLAFVCALEIAYAVLLAALEVLTAFLMFKHSFALRYVGSLVDILDLIFLIYFSFLCSLSVVVAVAEPGCHGASAVRRAWHLMKYKKRHVTLFIVVTGALNSVVSPVRTLAKACAQSNMASGLLLGLLYMILMVVMEVFATLAMTAFYYECKKSTDASVTEYVKVSSQELV